MGTGQKIKPEDVVGELIKGKKVVVLVIPVIPMKLLFSVKMPITK